MRVETVTERFQLRCEGEGDGESVRENDERQGEMGEMEGVGVKGFMKEEERGLVLVHVTSNAN